MLSTPRRRLVTFVLVGTTLLCVFLYRCAGNIPKPDETQAAVGDQSAPTPKIMLTELQWLPATGKTPGELRQNSRNLPPATWTASPIRDWRGVLISIHSYGKGSIIQEPPEVEREFDELVLRASRGDSGAALSLHFARPNCEASSVNVLPKACQSQPGLLAEPMYWLLKAADAGDHRAALPLLDVARDLARGNSDPLRSTWFASRSLEALHAAAARGIVEALPLLAVTYTDGLIVPRDPPKAFAYWNVYFAATADEGARAAATGLLGQLRKSDWAIVSATERSVASKPE